MFRLSGAVCALFSVCALVSAHAEVHSSASFDSFALSLKNLNRAGGFKPGASMTGGMSSVSLWAQNPTTGVQDSQYLPSNTPFVPVSTTVTESFATASAVLNGKRMLGARGSVGADVTGSGTPNYAGADASPLTMGAVTLAPWTEAVFTVNANLFTQTTVGLIDGGVGESAYASVSLSFMFNPSGGGQSNSFSSLSLNAGALGTWDPNTGTWIYTGQTASLSNQQVRLVIDNASDQSLTGFLTLQADASGSSSYGAGPTAVPVPEPDTIALMGLGLSALAWATRVGKRKQA